MILFRTIGFRNLQLTLLQRANRRIIFDYDDALMFREQKQQQPLNGKNFRKFLRTVNRCVAVVAGNDFLGCFAEACGKDVVVLPTPVDLTRYQPRRHADGRGLTIGWIGLSDGLPYVRHIQPALQRLTQLFPGLKLKVICDKPLNLDGVAVGNEPWQQETEQSTLASFDIGIMPLWDSVWTRGKCGYKILQYMSAGVPVVASAVGANCQIISSGENGFLAASEEDWVTCLTRLVQHAELRRQFGLRGREHVEKSYSLEHFARAYVELLRRVVKSSV